MKNSLGALAAATAFSILALTGCGGPDVTQNRVEDAVGPAFANLYAHQQVLLGHILPVRPQASATCKRNSTGVANQGAGDDWVCQLLLQLSGPTSLYTYELDVKANGCYVADGPPALIGGRTLTTASGRNVTNPLFAFDGCFDT
jgi:ABC-2 type transport system permease protein